MTTPSATHDVPRGMLIVGPRDVRMLGMLFAQLFTLVLITMGVC